MAWRYQRSTRCVSVRDLDDNGTPAHDDLRAKRAQEASNIRWTPPVDRLAGADAGCAYPEIAPRKLGAQARGPVQLRLRRRARSTEAGAQAGGERGHGGAWARHSSVVLRRCSRWRGRERRARWRPSPYLLGWRRCATARDRGVVAPGAAAVGEHASMWLEEAPSGSSHRDERELRPSPRAARPRARVPPGVASGAGGWWEHRRPEAGSPTSLRRRVRIRASSRGAPARDGSRASRSWQTARGLDPARR
jgi:hypothetical protein